MLQGRGGHRRRLLAVWLLVNSGCEACAWSSLVRGPWGRRRSAFMAVALLLGAVAAQEAGM
jgi:hypothetical protein